MFVYFIFYCTRSNALTNLLEPKILQPGFRGLYIFTQYTYINILLIIAICVLRLQSALLPLCCTNLKLSVAIHFKSSNVCLYLVIYTGFFLPPPPLLTYTD